MIEKLETKQSKRMFLTLILLMLFGIFSVQHLIIPLMFGIPIQINIQLVQTILDKLFTSVLVTVGLALFIYWLNPRNKKNAQMKILQPIEIGQNFPDARKNTQIWWFNGTSGRYTRSETLPSLAIECRRNNKPIDIIIQILNPNNAEICGNYASYRNSLRTGSKKELKKTDKSIQLDLLATIVSAYIRKTEQPQLKIKIGLKNHFSTFRIDLSTHKVIITKEDPIEPAILYESGTFFYDAYYNEFIQTFSQSNQLDMNYRFVTESELSTEEIKKLLQNLNMFSDISESDLSKILELVKDRTNIYSA